uniref:Uncharacterized protein n=1 Tax=Rhizophora mucronata TaxID=61149 RepID=A0A2P2P044_RHIMU
MFFFYVDLHMVNGKFFELNSTRNREASLG